MYNTTIHWSSYHGSSAKQVRYL